MANKFLKSTILMPLSKLYGIVSSLRNAMFKLNLLEQREYDIPVIVVGNLQVGGTGKTPHTEYILDALRTQFHIGMISRGYKRRTRGFVLATDTTGPEEIGDEPYQIYQKFGRDVKVAVCEDRCEGIERLRKIDPEVNLVVLDDAFQHRYVKPSVSVVCTEFSRPFFMDKMLPLGRLRESALGVERADMVIITKCPSEIKPIENRILKKNLDLLPWQGLYFSRYIYGRLEPLFPVLTTYATSLNTISDSDSILGVSGIANPKPFYNRLKETGATVKMLMYPDHHNFTQRDFDIMERRYDELKGTNKYIITTEKDAARMIRNEHFPKRLKSAIYYLPIEVEFDATYSPAFTEGLLKRLREATTPLHRQYAK